MSAGAVQGLAVILAAIAAMALVWAAFYPLLERNTRAANRLAAVTAPRGERSESIEDAEAARSIRRVHEAALKAVAESKRARQASWLSARLAAAGSDWPQARFTVCCTVGSLVAFFVLAAMGMPAVFALAVAGFSGWGAPLIVLGLLARRRRETFVASFTAAVDMMRRGTRSGLSVADCLTMIAADADPAVRKEFAAIVAQLRAGVPLAEAMTRLATAMPLPEVRFFVLIMSMQAHTGGNFMDALSNLASVLRERQRLAAKVRTASAEVRASAIAVGILPVVVAGAVAVVSPDYISVLWNTESGRRVLLYSAVWMAIGVMVLRRMSRIEP